MVYLDPIFCHSNIYRDSAVCYIFRFNFQTVAFWLYVWVTWFDVARPIELTRRLERTFDPLRCTMSSHIGALGTLLWLIGRSLLVTWNARVRHRWCTWCHHASVRLDCWHRWSARHHCAAERSRSICLVCVFCLLLGTCRLFINPFAQCCVNYDILCILLIVLWKAYFPPEAVSY